MQPREFTLVLPSNLGVLSLIGRSPATNVITATKEFGTGAEPPIWAPILAISATIGAQKHHDRFGRRSMEASASAQSVGRPTPNLP